jgi:hypothetical protein
MIYRILKQNTRETLDAIELHVLARAYYAAWRHVHHCPPLDEHTLPGLNLVIQYLPEH